jgi:hypothetical protein
MTTTNVLEPDREQLEAFVNTIFRYAGDRGYVAIRSFFQENNKVFRRSIAGLSGGLKYLIDVAEDDARRAAQNPTAVVFCPPLAVFAGKGRAREEDVLLGPALSVECDEHPLKARVTLEALLGPATVVVQSGGRWINGGGAPEDKLHLHWRLAKPAEGKDCVRREIKDLIEPVAWKRCEVVNKAERESLKTILEKWGVP